MSINRVVISGNLTGDPELRATQSGTDVLSFGVAVNDRRKNPQTGEWEDCPNFVDCTMFGNRAGSIRQYLSKGTKVSVEGKLRWSQWERDGQKRSKLEVIVDEIEFMSAKKEGAQPAYGAPQPNTYTYPNQPAMIPPAAPQPAYQYTAPAPSYQYAAPAPSAAPSAGAMPAPAAPAPATAQPSVYADDIPF